jgi:hypothetical protein
MATTTNYSWTTPDDTALVKDGAAAIRSLGTAIDSTVFTNAGAAVAKATVDAKGDLIAGTADNTVDRLAVGANDTVLTADSSTATGLKWAAAGGAADYTLLNAGGTALTGAGTITVNITAYSSLLIYIFTASSASASSVFTMRFNGDSTTKYNDVFWSLSDATPSVGQTVDGTAIGLGTLGNSAGQDFTFVMKVDGAKTTGIKPYWGLGHNGGSAEVSRNVSGYYAGTSAITSVSIISGTGNFDNGTIYIYGA